MPYTLEVCGLSDIGLIRENNEDVWGEIEDLRFFVLADGMGGHRAGEVASREAVSHLLELLKDAFKVPKNTVKEAAKALTIAIAQVNQMVFNLSKSNLEYKGMGTTLSCLLFKDNFAITGHVGDSRIYRYRNGKVQLLTKDDSLFRELVDLGQLSEFSSPEFAYKNVITKAIGTDFLIEPSLSQYQLRNNDIFLMCTDGLSDLVTQVEMETTLKKNIEVEKMVKELIDLAIKKGGHDNVTVLIIKCIESI